MLTLAMLTVFGVVLLVTRDHEHVLYNVSLLQEMQSEMTKLTLCLMEEDLELTHC